MRITEALISLMFLSFLLELFFPEKLEYFSFSFYKSIKYPWVWITNAFLHASVAHLLFNTIVIWSLGSLIESEIGKRNYLLLFVTSVVIANLAFGLMYPKQEGIGSSGFAFALCGIATILNPYMIVLVWFVPMTMRTAGIFFFLLELTLLLLFPGSKIGHIAHLSGFAVGVLFGYFLKRKVIKEEFIEYGEYY